MKNLFTFTLALSSLIFIDAEAQVASPQMGSATGVTQQAPTEKQPTKAQPVSKKKKKAKKASPVSDDSNPMAQPGYGNPSIGNSKSPAGTVVQPNKPANNMPDPAVNNNPNASVMNSPGSITPATTVSNDVLISKSTPIVTQDKSGSVDWTNQYIEATGESVIDNDRFKNPAQAKAMASRGAVVVAQRNLLEETKGVSVVGETTVKDMITSSDYVYSRVEGVVKGAVMVGQPIEANGMVTVRLRMPLYAVNGLAGALYNNIPGNEAFATNTAGSTQGAMNNNNGANGNSAAVRADAANGAVGSNNSTVTPSNANGMLADAQRLVFNTGGKKFDPSMFPVIMDANGNLLLDLKKIYDPNTGQFPQMVQASKQVLQDLNMQKGVQVLNVIQDKMSTGKIVISADSVKKVNWAKVGATAAKVGKILMMFL
jgi:hypothetical protein